MQHLSGIAQYFPSWVVDYPKFVKAALLTQPTFLHFAYAYFYFWQQ